MTMAMSVNGASLCLTAQFLMVKGTTNSMWIMAVAHGRYMDIIPVRNVAGLSSTSYSDYYWFSGGSSRVVYRGFYSANVYGGVACSNVYYDASYSTTFVGARLAFRGQIVKAQSVAVYKLIREKA